MEKNVRFETEVQQIPRPQANYGSPTFQLADTNGKKIIYKSTFGTQQEFKWRAGAASFWAIVLVPLMLVLFQVLLNTAIFHPLSWIQGTISAVFSWQFMLSTLAIQMLSLPIVIFYYKCAKVYPVHHRYYWNQLLFLLSPKQLSWILMSGLLGVLFAIVLCSSSYEVIWTKYFQNEFNEPVKYLLLFGFILGLRYGVCFYTNKKYSVSFPVLQEQRFVRFRASLSSCLKTAIIECLQTLKVCFISYLLFVVVGGSFNFLFSTSSSWSYFISSNSPFLNVSMLWLCLTLGTVILLIFNIAESLFKIFTTQAYSFCLETNFIGDQRLLLQEALVSNHEILKHLAFLDLCECSKYDSSRRKQMFTITQPGGHPETWNMVLPQCLALIERSKLRFADASMCQIKNETAKQPFALFSPDKKTGMKGYMGSPAQGAIPSPLFSPHKGLGGIGSPEFRPPSASLFSPGKSWSSTEDIKSSVKIDAVSESRKKEETSRFSQKLPVFSGLFEELPDYKTQELFQDRQLISWVLEGLSFIVAASFTEDTYGVVQRNLPDILVSLLSYLETIERYIKSTVSDERLQLQIVRDFQKKKTTSGIALSYRIAVQSAIYRITTKFGKNLESLRIPHDHRKRLNAFTDFKD